jgi:hypothetical protein
MCPMGQHALKNVNNCLNTNIYSYLETSGGQSSILYLNVVHFFQQRDILPSTKQQRKNWKMVIRK